MIKVYDLIAFHKKKSITSSAKAKAKISFVFNNTDLKKGLYC
jgi:hypothetical protein